MGKPIALFLTFLLTYHILNISSESLPNSDAANSSGNVNADEIHDIGKQIDMPKRNTDNLTEEKKNTDNLRKPVKLTMKQGLLMNQVLSTYVMNDVRNADCKKHKEEYKTGLRAFEPWALKMFDSSSKIQAGILYGNLAEFGSFDQCLAIYHDTKFGPIRGKLCTLRIKPDLQLLKIIARFNNISDRRFEKVKSSVMEASHLLWSVCVPDTCKAIDILPHFNKTIKELSEGVVIKVLLEDSHCSSSTDEIVMENWEYFLIFILLMVIIIGIVATIIDFVASNKTGSHWFVDSFCLRANLDRMLEKNSKPGELDCLHGIRFLSICYVLYGHRYMATMMNPTVNSFYLLEWILKYTSTLIIGGTVCVDTFLLLSGLLVSYNFFIYMRKYRKFSLFQFYIYRYIRITIPLSVAIIWNAILIKHLGSGPLWYDTLQGESVNCQYFWWSSLLNVQSYVNPHAMCIVQTWYLTVDMIMYYISPLIMYPLYKWPNYGYINYFIFYAMSLLSSFYVAWIHEYEGSMPLTATLLSSEYIQKHYFTPHTRGSPYIIGLGFGYWLFETKNQPVKMPLLFLIIGWCTSISFLLAPVVGAHVFQEETHEYDRFESSIFLSCSRSGWTLGVVWIIWCCVKGYGGIINTVLASYIFKVLGKITYGIFLFHLTIQFLLAGAARHPYYFSDFKVIYQFFSDAVLMIIFGFVFTLLYESPFIRLQTIFLSRKKDSSNQISIEKNGKF